MRYGSICSGIEAATMAWHILGWEPAFFSEIEQFPREVLAHHYPEVPCHGDFTTIREDDYGSIELLVGGTPCQSFSIAGLRGGMDDERGNLALEFIKLAQRKWPKWVVWENVPGVLSSNGGRDFGSFLGALAEIGYGFAYRVLDAQYFGVAQRRRRVFVVGYLGDWRRAAAVLFERESLSGNPAPSREKGEKVAPDAEISSGSDPELMATLCAKDNEKWGCNQWVDEGKAIICPTPNRHGVRRLTPTECERLQGFPDGFTQIPYRNKPADKCPDGPRYKALGNSMAVPVMRWIGERIQQVDNL
jgi:DNA (cytosine-5)-methyltransferase 1